MEYLAYFKTFDETFWTLVVMTVFVLGFLASMSLSAINTNSQKELNEVLSQIKPHFIGVCAFVFICLGFVSLKGLTTFLIMGVVAAFLALSIWEMWKEYSWMRFNGSRLENPEETKAAK